MQKCILFLFLIISSNCSNSEQKTTIIINNLFENNSQIPPINFNQLKKKGKTAFAFCKVNKMDTNFCVLVNMGMHSGLNRFYIWKFSKDTFIKAFPVSHGCGMNSWNSDYSKENAVFSNEDGSHCSALGKYKLGERGYSNWGINVKYLMHGLDKTNNNSLARQIVFHSWENIPDNEVYPNGTPEGWGCPAISNNNFLIIDPLIQASKKPVLMWIFN